jgi:hypothetical protein
VKNNDIKEALGALFGAIEKDSNDEKHAFIENNKDSLIVKRVSDCIAQADVEILSWMYDDLDDIVSAVLLSKGINNKLATFVLTRARVIERNIESLIRQYEGRVCCVDKSRTIMRAIIRHLCHDEPISFNYQAQYTFHYPRIVFTDQDSIMAFVEGLYRLEYGTSMDFLLALQAVGEVGSQGVKVRREAVANNSILLNQAYPDTLDVLIKNLASAAHNYQCDLALFIARNDSFSKVFIVQYKSKIKDSEVYAHCLVAAENEDDAHAVFDAMKIDNAGQNDRTFVKAYQL